MLSRYGTPHRAVPDPVNFHYYHKTHSVMRQDNPKSRGIGGEIHPGVHTWGQFRKLTGVDLPGELKQPLRKLSHRLLKRPFRSLASCLPSIDPSDVPINFRPNLCLSAQSQSSQNSRQRETLYRIIWFDLSSATLLVVLRVCAVFISKNLHILGPAPARSHQQHAQSHRSNIVA